MRVMTYSEVRNQLKAVIDTTIDDADVTIIHRRDNEDAVLMGRAHYDSLMETLHLLSSPANARSLAEAIAQDKAGRATERPLIHPAA